MSKKNQEGTYEVSIGVKFYGKAHLWADSPEDAQRKLEEGDYDDWMGFLRNAQPDDGDIDVDESTVRLSDEEAAQ